MRDEVGKGGRGRERKSGKGMGKEGEGEKCNGRENLLSQCVMFRF